MKLVAPIAVALPFGVFDPPQDLSEALARRLGSRTNRWPIPPARVIRPAVGGERASDGLDRPGE